MTKNLRVKLKAVSATKDRQRVCAVTYSLFSCAAVVVLISLEAVRWRISVHLRFKFRVVIVKDRNPSKDGLQFFDAPSRSQSYRTGYLDLSFSYRTLLGGITSFHMLVVCLL